ncbi:MAG: hypothetical protein J6J36_06475 [Clostridia bacterium]|nr:hypothetical protein [Clostridia bacterium]
MKDKPIILDNEQHIEIKSGDYIVEIEFSNDNVTLEQCLIKILNSF